MANVKRVPISFRISEPVLAWFKHQKPKGYQSLIHSVLEEHVRSQTQRNMWSAGRAQEIFRKYYAQCFWHYDRNLKIEPSNLHIVVDGLKKFGGREGLLLAEELCQ